MKILPSVGIWLATLLAFSGPLRAQLTFALNYDSGIDAQALAGFQEAAELWSSVLTDPITVNLDISFSALLDPVLGSTTSYYGFVDYSSLKAALARDVTSPSDAQSVASLPSGTSYSLLVNHPNTGANDDRFYATANLIGITTANAKALGLSVSASPGADATIAFNSTFAFDFDPSDGIEADAFDFVGTAVHEIGHALGFTSASVSLDAYPALADSMVAGVLDLSRYSILSGGTIDLTADPREKYFSIDGGATYLAAFSTGTSFGDGYQASHWKDALGLGLMDPTAGYGDLDALTALDLQAMDVIGYDLAAVPEPADCAVIAAAVAGLAVVVVRRRRGHGCGRAGDDA